MAAFIGPGGRKIARTKYFVTGALYSIAEGLSMHVHLDALISAQLKGR